MKIIPICTLIFVITSCGPSPLESFSYDSDLSYRLLAHSKILRAESSRLFVFIRRNSKRQDIISDQTRAAEIPDYFTEDASDISEILRFLRTDENPPPNTSPGREVPITFHLFFEEAGSGKNLGYIRVFDYGTYTFSKPYSASGHYRYSRIGGDLKNFIGTEVSDKVKKK